MDNAITHYTNEFRSSRDVSPYDAEVLFDAMIAERDEDLLTDLLSAWTRKGATEDELFRFAVIMRSRMRRVVHKRDGAVDIVGTGGSRVKTFNVSTAAAFVVAGAGVPVAKHGNRAATSLSGSSDVLAELGIDVDIDASKSEASLAEHGICFMFAPRFHSLSPTLAAARRRVGRPTIFNNLGPLCNPASVSHQLLGVCDGSLVQKTGRVLVRLGTRRSWIVCGDGGLDEIAMEGKTSVMEVAGDSVESREIDTNVFGIEPLPGELPTNCSPQKSAQIIEGVLTNKLRSTLAETLIAINAAAAIYIVGKTKSLERAAVVAIEAIRSGAALEKLELLRR